MHNQSTGSFVIRIHNIFHFHFFQKDFNVVLSCCRESIEMYVPIIVNFIFQLLLFIFAHQHMQFHCALMFEIFNKFNNGISKNVEFSWPYILIRKSEIDRAVKKDIGKFDHIYTVSIRYNDMFDTKDQFSVKTKYFQ